MNKRITFYLREKKDKDIIDYLDNVEEGDTSREIRNLLRMGIEKKQQLEHQVYVNSDMSVIQSHTNIIPPHTIEREVVESSSSPSAPAKLFLNKNQIKKHRYVDDETLENRL